MFSALNPVAFSQAFAEGLALLTRHWRLTVEMAKRDLMQRYAGQFIGLFWIIGHPLFLICLFVFIFGVVFKMKIGGTYEMPLDYTTYILSGLVPWLTFQTALSASCVSVVSNSSLVKQFVFHLEVLPAKDVLTSLVIWFVGIPIVIVYVLITQQMAFFIWLTLPLVFGLQLLAMIGIAFLMSAITVFLRDLKDFVTLFATVNMYLMPVVYLPDMVPSIFRPVLYLNPFSYMIWVYQDVLYFGRFEHPVAWVIYALGSLAIFSFGYSVFRRLKPMFANFI